MSGKDQLIAIETSSVGARGWPWEDRKTTMGTREIWEVLGKFQSWIMVVFAQLTLLKILHWKIPALGGK